MALIERSKKQLSSSVPQLRLRKQLGQGGNGTVYSAVNSVHERVAVKFFLNDDRRRWQRFVDEVKVVTTRLASSPRVIPILESKLSDHGAEETPWYIMPMATPIRGVLNARTWREMLPAFIELADGLAELHAAGVAHRDIKPENLFQFQDTYRFGDFGIAAFPEREGITREDEPMGPASFMAPEMEANAGAADPLLADVYSLAKTMWALLADEKFAFPGQYRPKGSEGLSARPKAKGFVVEPLEALLEQATASAARDRPIAAEFSKRLREVASVQDSGIANVVQWEFASLEAMTGLGVTRAEWRDAKSIRNVVQLLSRYHGMNHCFFPEGGGHHIEGASLCEGGAMLALRISSWADYVVSPVRLLVERFPDHPAYAYAVLEVGAVARLTDEDKYLDGPSELLRRLNDFDYLPNDRDEYEPRFSQLGEPCYRRFERGLMVLAPTSGIFNRIDDYMGTAERLGVDELRKRFGALVERADRTPNLPRRLAPKVRLLNNDTKRVPFELRHLSMEQFWQLFDIDEEKRRVRDDSASGIVKSTDLLELRRRRAEDPWRGYALATLKALSIEQQGEYLALIDVGRGLIDPEGLTDEAAVNARTTLHQSYLLEKLGNRYLRRALEQFGLEPVGDAVPPSTPVSAVEEDDEFDF